MTTQLDGPEPVWHVDHSLISKWPCPQGSPYEFLPGAGATSSSSRTWFWSAQFRGDGRGRPDPPPVSFSVKPKFSRLSGNLRGYVPEKLWESEALRAIDPLLGKVPKHTHCCLQCQGILLSLDPGASCWVWIFASDTLKSVLPGVSPASRPLLVATEGLF